MLLRGIGGKRQLAHGFVSGDNIAIIGGGTILNQHPTGSLNAGVTVGMTVVGIATSPTIQ